MGIRVTPLHFAGLALPARWAAWALFVVLAGCGQSPESAPADPGLRWDTPAPVAYGTALGATQLDATAAVPGVFSYSPASGEVLAVGAHTLSATFTPSDPTRYQAATVTVCISVNKVTPAITWTPPASIPFGTPLSSVQLNASANGVAGTLSYSPGVGTLLAAGVQTLSVTFLPLDSTTYESKSTSVTLGVNKATPQVLWPAPAPVAPGTALSAMQLDAMVNGIAGSFSYSPPAGSVPASGLQKLTGTFTPADNKDYEVVTASQMLTVLDTAPAIATQPQDQSVGVGQSATFTVTATGAHQLTYQWLRNSVPIAGATSPSYTVSAAGVADSGTHFSVIVSDTEQYVVSYGAKLTVTASLNDSYYVAIGGSDLSTGSASAPFATLQRAQQAMQTSTTKATQIEEGTYYLTSPLLLTGADQGETWEAAPGARVTLSGGDVITGWSLEGNGVYSAQVAQPVGVDLTIGGRRQMPADLGFDPDEPYTSGWRTIAPNQAPGNTNTFAVYPADLTASVKPGALVQVIDHCRWTDLFTRILSVDSAKNTITVAAVFDAGTSQGHAGSWRVLGDAADLSAPGQFAYDPASSKVYLVPAKPADLDSLNVVAAQLKTLVSLNNTSGITISGITFADTTSDTIDSAGSWDDSGAAITAENVSNSAISGNTFVNVGRGLVLSGSSDNTIAGNVFRHVGVSGISLSSNCNRNKVASNSLRDIGESNLGSFGLSINDSSNNVVDNNLIDGVGRWGIVFGPSGDPNDTSFANTGNVFSNNVIRNTSNQTNDTGAIYGGAPTANGYLNETLLITGNRIENVGGLIREGSGRYDAGFAQGIYLDDHLSGVTLTNNVIESGGTYGVILCHGCEGNSASNNVVVLQPPPIYDRGTYGSTFATGEMDNNGTTWIDLLPSYFPSERTTSTIVVQLSGQSFGGTLAAFNVQVDGAVIGTGTAAIADSDYVFRVAVTPHQIHRVGIALTNGSDAGAATTALHNLGLIVNNTAVSLAAPEATGGFGAYGFAAIPDDLMVTNFSVTQNIVYRNGGSSQDVFDMTSGSYPSYVDQDPGVIDSNILYQNVFRAADTIFGSQLLDSESILADPAFANPASGDYRIQVGSPALSAGFKPTGVPLAP